MIGDLCKAIAGAIGLANFWSKYFGDKKLIDQGAELQKGADDAEKLKTIANVNRPVSNVESFSMWERNKAKYGRRTEPK